MFKNTNDEAVFDKVLDAYIEEFGAESVTIYVPKHVSDVVDVTKYGEPLTVRVWNKRKYGIRVREFNAVYDLPLEA